MNSRTTMLFFGAAGILGIPLVCAFFLLFFFAPVGGLGASAATCQAIADSSTLPPGAGGGTVRPVKDIAVSSPFGSRTNPATGEVGEFHQGDDFPDAGGGGLGASIYAYADGKVAAAGAASGFGQWIVIDHNINGQLVSTVYGHMYPDGVLVQKGQEVKAGQVIAKIGSNGQATGPHLHFEYWPGGRLTGKGHPVDPLPYVQAAREPGTPAPKNQDHNNDQQNLNEADNNNNDGSDLGGFELPKPDGPGEQNKNAEPIPSNYLAAYKAAGQKYGIPWELLAGIGNDESSHGQDNSAGIHSGQNPWGAMGPMQFLQGTWDTYGVDGNGDGVKNVYDIADAAFGAANYLVASGVKKGPQGVWDALWAYNHLHAYANDVLRYAWSYATGKVIVVPGQDGGQCAADSGGVLRNGGDTSRGTKGNTDVKLNWPAETATVDDPTTSGKITPRMMALLDAIKKSAPSKPASIGCYRVAHHPPDHMIGKACDLMFTPANTPKNIDAGWAMANWLVANQKVLGVKYVIWQGKIWTSYREAQHWRTYVDFGCPDPSAVTTCHYDHVHVTVW
ncbi:MAG TPA: peptidoglycan DD-metalloendopeptidase family protein [Streptosporangiales bacterium]